MIAAGIAKSGSQHDDHRPSDGFVVSACFSVRSREPGTSAFKLDATEWRRDALSRVRTRARYVWVAYQNPTQVMKVYYSASPTPSGSPLLEMILPQDLSTVFGGQVYFGITAGTGSCYTQQFLRAMEIHAGPVK